MSNHKRQFEDQNHTLLYKNFRPGYKDNLIQKIIGFLKEKNSGPYDLAVDVGCGTGQATTLLCKHFKQVLGYDISENQIKQAKHHEADHLNLKFYAVPCEKLNLDHSSVDLVVVANAIHWFDLDLFFEECKRILKPNGVLAFFTNK